MQLFELFDSASGLSEVYREMTHDEAQLRNDELKCKRDSRRWIECEEEERLAHDLFVGHIGPGSN